MEGGPRLGTDWPSPVLFESLCRVFALRGRAGEATLDVFDAGQSNWFPVHSCQEYTIAAQL